MSNSVNIKDIIIIIIFGQTDLSNSTAFRFAIGHIVVGFNFGSTLHKKKKKERKTNRLTPKNKKAGCFFS